jgi:hypothetical protein
MTQARQRVAYLFLLRTEPLQLRGGWLWLRQRAPRRERRYACSGARRGRALLELVDTLLQLIESLLQLAYPTVQ